MQKLLYTLHRLSGPPVRIEVGAQYDQTKTKDILCVPTQTNCAQACTFCHTTGMRGKLPVTNLTPLEIETIVRDSWRDSGQSATEDRPLLVSFMGVGEPIANTGNLLIAMIRLKAWAAMVQLPIRFGLATMLPQKHMDDFDTFTNFVKGLNLPLKVHFSMHYPYDGERRKWMPAAANLHDALAAIGRYQDFTGNPTEIHYTLIEGSNDKLSDMQALRELLRDSKIPVKFLAYNPVPGDSRRSPEDAWITVLRTELEKDGIPTEWYDSPGADIAAACGMFAVDSYFPPPELPANVVAIDSLRQPVTA